MSGFDLRSLKKTHNQEDHIETTKYCKHIVYGENIYGVLTFLKLNEKYPGEVKLITNNSYLKEDFENELKTSLNSIRSQAVADELNGLNASLEITPSQTKVKFYKDTKFQPFGGRAKPHDIKSNEEFFIAPYFNFNSNAILKAEQRENFDQLMSENQTHKLIKSIEMIENTDLADQTNFKVHTGDYENFTCENLYFCESPKKFFNLVSNKDSLPESVQKFCVTIENHSAIAVHFKAKAEVYPESGSLIIPQSMTHEWGSFLLDIEPFNPTNSTQELTAVTFLSEDDVQEEDLAKKIKLMRRVIERVLPEFTEENVDQMIRFSDEFDITGVDDTLFSDLQSEHVKFCGHASPIDKGDSNDFKYFSRAYYAIMKSNF